MLPPERLPMPPQWRGLLEELAPVFARRSTHRLFMALACGLILADRGTVTGMAAASGTGRQWRRGGGLVAGAEMGPGRPRPPRARPVGEVLPPRGGPGHGAGDGDLLPR